MLIVDKTEGDLTTWTVKHHNSRTMNGKTLQFTYRAQLIKVSVSGWTHEYLQQRKGVGATSSIYVLHRYNTRDNNSHGCISMTVPQEQTKMIRIHAFIGSNISVFKNIHTMYLHYTCNLSPSSHTHGIHYRSYVNAHKLLYTWCTVHKHTQIKWQYVVSYKTLL